MHQIIKNTNTSNSTLFSDEEIYNNIYRVKALFDVYRCFFVFNSGQVKYSGETIAYLPINLSVHPFIYLSKLEVGGTKGMKITKRYPHKSQMN